MPRLILLNGPPACGKSTLARRFVEEHPLALNLDIDHVRRLIGRWRDDPHTAGLLARQIALAAARVHLAAGHDVVVPQFLGRLAFVEELEGLARAVGATFHEIVLLDSRANMLRRFAARTQAAAEPAHVEAGELVDRGEVGEGGEGGEEVSVMYDRLISVAVARRTATLVRAEEGGVELTFQAVLHVLR